MSLPLDGQTGKASEAKFLTRWGDNDTKDSKGDATEPLTKPTTTRIPPNEFPSPTCIAEVHPALFLGDVRAIQPPCLKAHDITAAITLLSSCNHKWNRGSGSSTCIHNIEDHLFIKCRDHPTQDLLSHMTHACEFIDRILDSKRKVLVHCAMGVSRSATMVIAYLMRKHKKLGPDMVLAQVKAKRAVVKPNEGFMEQLLYWVLCDYQPLGQNHVVPHRSYRNFLIGHCVYDARTCQRYVERRNLDRVYSRRTGEKSEACKKENVEEAVKGDVKEAMKEDVREDMKEDMKETVEEDAERGGEGGLPPAQSEARHQS